MDGLWTFVFLAVAVSATPGPDDVLVLNSCLRGGPRLGAATAFGAATGALIWGGAAAVGLAAVVSRSAAVYDGIRLAGAAYLVVLGVVPLVTQVLGARAAAPAAQPGGPTSRPAGLRTAFTAGLMSDLLNRRRPLVGALLLRLPHRHRWFRRARVVSRAQLVFVWFGVLKIAG